MSIINDHYFKIFFEFAKDIGSFLQISFVLSDEEWRVLLLMINLSLNWDEKRGLIDCSSSFFKKSFSLPFN